MPKTDNVQSIRLYESLCKHSDQATAERIAHKIPLSKSADFMKKFKWAESICTDLEREFDDDTVKQIRMDCACGPGADRINIVKEIYQSTADINNFVTKMNAKNFGFTLSQEGNALLFTYPTCYCSCVKRVHKPLSKVWCYCTLGWTKRLFDCVLDCDTNVELLESIKLSDSRCVMKITRKH